MLFNSWSFLLFFPLVLGTYWALPHRWRWAWLLAASCVFYMAFVPAYVLILFAVIGIDYAAGRLIARSEGATRRRWLLLSVAANLAMLGFFKYFNFFADNARALADLIGWNLPLPVLQILLPIGLSFHVFQSLSYTIEVYRGHQAPERHLGIYALYVMFWPQLVAGPIERPQNLLPQFHAEQRFDPERLAAGLRLMGWGFFKKVVIADHIAILTERIFAWPFAYGGLTLVLAAVLFAFQIYCDFSGYSDIARGAARTLGIDLMVNFRRPYFARSIQEFWTRWHISLSTWFRDYVYIPLGGNRVGKARWSLNLLIVFLVSGLWHGANWTYVAWGGLHGLYLLAGIWTKGLRERAYALSGLTRHPALLAGLQGLTVFGLVTVAWICFRAPSLGHAKHMLTHLHSGLWAQLTTQEGLLAALSPFGDSPRRLAFVLVAIGLLLIGETLEARGSVMARLATWPRPLRWAAYQAGIAVIVLSGAYDSRTFIYFQF